MPAVAGELASDVAHLFFGCEDVDVDYRLQDDRPRLGERIEECFAARGHEGDVFRIHRVRLAVVDDDSQILQRKARDVAALEDVAHALLDGWNELPRNRAALHSVDELEAFPARQRL